VAVELTRFRINVPYLYQGGVVVNWESEKLRGQHESGEGALPEDIEGLTRVEYLSMWTESGKPVRGRRSNGKSNFPSRF